VDEEKQTPVNNLYSSFMVCWVYVKKRQTLFKN
jgi:hypothetical protein